MERKLIRTLIACVALLTAVHSAHARTEFGKLQGAEFRIDLPDNWNHGLVVYYHGYRAEDHGGSFDQTKPLRDELAVFTKAGYAVIQSGYSRGGWALEQAIPETEALRQYFIQHYGQPAETYGAGHSMGGMLTIMTLEQSPQNYAAGLDLCGATGEAPALLGRAFDAHVTFDYYFPGALPEPVKVPADFKVTEEQNKRISDLLETKPQAAAALLRWAGLHDNNDLASDLVFGTWVLKDIEQRAGGNPFDNRNTIYNGTSDDNALNDGVKRYAADPGALAYLQRYYTPTGRLTRPVLAIHTTYDELVSPSVPSSYAQLVRKSGAGDLFAVQYVEHDHHCNITPEEIGRGFSELRQWKDKGTVPTPGRLP